MLSPTFFGLWSRRSPAHKACRGGAGWLMLKVVLFTATLLLVWMSNSKTVS